MTTAEKRGVVETLRTDYSVRQIWDTLGFNRSSLYYEPKKDPSEEMLQQDIENLSTRYPRYGYRRITELLVRMGYTVGYRRVARLMKSANLLVSVIHSCQTTKSLEGKCQWDNRLDNLDICRRNQVWFADITYVRLRGHFVYVSVLMDVFTRMIRGWQLCRHLTQPLTLRPQQQALRQSVPEIHHNDQGVQYLSSEYISTLTDYGIEISLPHRGCPWENGYVGRFVQTLKEEEIHLNDYDDITDAHTRIGQFIEKVYNQKRAHSALGYLTPIEFEKEHLS
ncbi:IS3 family transposase [Candidatus Poribacteria bacterium]|nr:MAG: IS3 family transposase [Candidatus Poribacteria bacterium]